MVKGSRAWQLIKGIAFLIIATWLSGLLNLKILKLTKFVYENDEYTADEIKKDVHRSFILKYKKVFEENKEDLRNFLEMEYDKL